MRLVVFFSRGMSLEGWRQAGILDRELALYRALLPNLEHLAFLTYGGAEDRDLVSQMPGVQVLSNRWRLPSNLYSVLAPLIHWRTLSRATILKTNQINGAWSALIARRLFRKKLIVRCGFLWSDFMARLHGGTWRPNAALRLERRAFRAADVVVVTTHADQAVVTRRYGVDRARVHVIPNYVDTAAFRPMSEVVRQPNHVICVGRLDDQKNLFALIEAVGHIPNALLTFVGDGPRRGELHAAAQKRNVRAEFLGTRPHAELPRLLNASTVFVLPSHYEGNPKALVEAMACGMPVIGTRVPGIQEIVVHRENGYLCDTSADALRVALQEVLDDSALRAQMSAGARSYALRCCTVESAVERELGLLRGLHSTGNDSREDPLSAA